VSYTQLTELFARDCQGGRCVLQCPHVLRCDSRAGYEAIAYYLQPGVDVARVAHRHEFYFHRKMAPPAVVVEHFEPRRQEEVHGILAADRAQRLDDDHDRTSPHV